MALWSGKKCFIGVLTGEARLDNSVIFCNMTNMMKMTGYKKVFESKAFTYE
jgi:hypothetical protein